MLGQCWHFVGNFVGPTLADNVGPTWFCSSGLCWHNMLAISWPNSSMPTKSTIYQLTADSFAKDVMLGQHWPNNNMLTKLTGTTVAQWSRWLDTTSTCYHCIHSPLQCGFESLFGYCPKWPGVSLTCNDMGESLPVTYYRLVVLSRYSGFLYQYNWPSRCSTNGAKSDVKPHLINQSI